MASSSAGRRRPRTKVSRSRPAETWSKVAICLARRTGLRPGSTMVVPIFRLGHGAGRVGHGGQGVVGGDGQDVGQPQGVEAELLEVPDELAELVARHGRTCRAPIPMRTFMAGSDR